MLTAVYLVWELYNSVYQKYFAKDTGTVTERKKQVHLEDKPDYRDFTNHEYFRGVRNIEDRFMSFMLSEYFDFIEEHFFPDAAFQDQPSDDNSEEEAMLRLILDRRASAKREGKLLD